MSTIVLDVKSPDYNFHGEFKRRITIVHGDSGTGKTSLVDALTIKSSKIVKTCNVKVVAVRNDEYWRSSFKETRDALLIFDDFEQAETMEFASLCKEYVIKHNLYVVLMDRAEAHYFSDNSSEKEKRKALSISTNEIYNFVNDGGINHWLEQDKIEDFETYDDVTCIITEDSDNGFKFYNKHLCNVVSAKDGKSAVIKTLQDVYKPGDKVLVLCDTAGFGVHFEEFKRSIVEEGLNARYVNNYESFEYALLKSNIFKNNPGVREELSNLFKYANKYVSWETYFEDLIERATEGQLYRCTHARHAILSDCYLEDCSSCHEEKQEKCSVKDCSSGKFNVLFKDTEFAMLLDLPRKVEREPKSEKMIALEALKSFDKV